MHIKQARAPIGHGRCDHSFKQNNPPAPATEAKQRNNILAFPLPASPSRTELGSQRTIQRGPRHSPRPWPLAWEGKVEPGCAALCSRRATAWAPSPPAPGPQAALQPRERSVKFDGPPPLPSSVAAPRQKPCRISLLDDSRSYSSAKTSRFQYWDPAVPPERNLTLLLRILLD